MGGEAVPQRMNADTLGDAGTPRCQTNDPMQLARTRMLPAVAGKQPGLTGRHPALLARNAPPFVQYIEQDGRENDVPILLALALLDPDDHPVTIDIGELERYDLRGSQAGGISQAQGGFRAFARNAWGGEVAPRAAVPAAAGKSQLQTAAGSAGRQ